MKKLGLADATFVPAPSVSSNEAPWLNLTFNGDLTRPGYSVLYSWYGALIEGAVSDEMRTDQVSTNQVIGGDDVTVVGLDGSSVDLGGGNGDVVSEQSFADDGMTVGSSAQADSAKDIEATISGLGLTPVSVDFVHVHGTAVRVVATYAGSTPVTWTSNQVLDELAGTPTRYEGIYFEVDDSNGSPMFISSVSYRTGISSVWTASGDADIFPTSSGGQVALNASTSPSATMVHDGLIPLVKR